jgi:hypothetical protein
MTLEMPFKDNDDLPGPDYCWSARRSQLLGRPASTRCTACAAPPRVSG